MDENNQQNITEDISAEASELQDIAKEWQKTRRREHWILTLWFLLAAAAVVFLGYTVLGGGVAEYVLLGAIPLPLLLLAVVEYRERAALKQLKQEHPALERIETSKSNLGCVVLLMCSALGGAFLYYALFDFVASGRVSSANSCARAVYQSVVSWQSELKEDGKNIPLETGIYYISAGMTPDEDSVAYNIYRYFHDAPYWCAVVCDEQGEILYTFFSEEEITEDELVPMEREQQCDIETNLFTRGEVVGWYAPQGE